MELCNDVNLILEVSNGSTTAFKSLFTRYKNETYSFALKVCQSATLAEDVVQIVFMTLWINRNRLKQIDNFGGYLRVVTRNEALQVLRGIARQSRAYANSAENWYEQHNETEETIFYNESCQILNAVLDKLPPQQKLVYKMCHLQGMKQQEVAEQLQISPLTVKAHLRQAMQRLRKNFTVEAAISLILIFFNF